MSILLYPYVNLHAANKIDIVPLELQTFKYSNPFPPTVIPIKILLVSHQEIFSNHQLSIYLSFVIREVKVYTRFYIIESERYKVFPGKFEFLVENLHVIQTCRQQFATLLNFMSYSNNSEMISDLSALRGTMLSGLCQGNPELNNLLYLANPPGRKTSKITSAIWWTLQTCQTNLYEHQEIQS